MKHKKAAISCWVSFGLFSLIILGEACMPSSASGQQSNWLANLFANLINDLTPTKVIEPIYPDALEIVPMAFLCEENEAIVGTTKVIDYVQTFPENPNNAPKHSNITFTRTDSSTEADYSYSITQTSSGGRIRIIPYRSDSFSFSLTDESGHVEEFPFTAIPLKEPEKFDVSFPSEMKIGQSALIEGTLTHEEVKDSENETADHYLRRFFDPSLYEVTSSNPSVIEVGKGYIRALSSGNAVLSHAGKEISSIRVTDEIMPSGTISATALTSNELHPLDYDYFETRTYGVPLFVNFSSEEMDQTILWESSNPLVARVTNTHTNSKGELVPGGFAMGYRLSGNATITGTLVSDPAQKVTYEFVSCEQAPSEAKFTFSSKGVNYDGSSQIPLSSGDTLSIKTSFLPENSSKTAVHVDVSDSEILLVRLNDSNSVSVVAKETGSARLSCYFVSNPALRIEVEVLVKAASTINDSNMGRFQIATRKFIGHFTLFAVTSLFGFLASMFTFFEGKWLALPINATLGTAYGAALAFLSEAIQKIPALQRGASMVDVGIDCLGAFAGVLVGVIVFIVVRYIRNRKHKKD